MGEYANFYNSKNGDRKYDAEAFTEWLKPFFVTGVFNGTLQVLKNEGMTVIVSPGTANIEGKTKTFNESTSLTIEVADATLNRIDNIIVRRDDEARDFSIMIQKGASSSNPVAPMPQRINGIYDLVLAQIYVKASSIEITQEDITDTRMESSLCGWVVSTVSEIDFEQITLQWQAYIERFYLENEAEFETWFAAFKELVGNDALVVVDGEMSNKSTNAIQNKVVKNYIDVKVSALEESKNTKLSGFTIAANSSLYESIESPSWDTEGMIAYRIAVTIEGVTENDKLNPVFDTKTQMSAALSPNGETFNGGAYFYFSEIPDWDVVCVELTKVKVY